MMVSRTRRCGNNYILSSGIRILDDLAGGAIATARMNASDGNTLVIEITKTMSLTMTGGTGDEMIEKETPTRLNIRNMPATDDASTDPATIRIP